MNATTLPRDGLEGTKDKKAEKPVLAYEKDKPEVATLLRALLAEVVGTFALTLVAAGGEVIGHVSHGEVSQAARVVAPGLVVMALIYAIGSASGAHFNPAVSLAFALRRDFPWSRVPCYWAAQMAGASVAALLLRALFGDVAHLGATEPHFGASAAFVMEIVLTFLLVLVILGTATRYSLIGPNAALAVGATIILDGLFAGPVSGASMNPARSLGPMLVSGELRDAWIYVAGPFLGGLAACGMVWLLCGPKKDDKEEEAAEGDQQKKG
ncbi:MAG: aquaporin [Armatimonadetes bacterium]|nr:aquaporin [Armatimonadota bacterium]